MLSTVCSNSAFYLVLILLAEIECLTFVTPDFTFDSPDFTLDTPVSTFDNPCSTTNEDSFAKRGSTWPRDNETPFPYKTNAPLNVVSELARPLNLSALRIYIDENEIFNISKTDSSVQILAPTDSKTSITGGPLFDDVYYLYKAQIFFSQDVEAPCCLIMDHRPAHPLMVEYMGINKRYKTMKEAMEKRDGFVEVAFGIYVQGTESNEKFSETASALININQGGYSLISHKKSASWHTHILEEGPDYYFAYPGVYIDENKVYHYCSTKIIFPIAKSATIGSKDFSYFTNLLTKVGAPINAVLATFPHKSYMPVIQGQNIIVKRF